MGTDAFVGRATAGVEEEVVAVVVLIVVEDG